MKERTKNLYTFDTTSVSSSAPTSSLQADEEEKSVETLEDILIIQEQKRQKSMEIDEEFRRKVYFIQLFLCSSPNCRCWLNLGKEETTRGS